ncbi:hypothetical protein D3C83_136110 [compost metagenome]
MDRLYTQLSSRIDALDHKIDRFRDELSARIGAVEARLTLMDDKISHQFLWLVGIQIAMMIAVVGALLRN